MCDDLEEIVCEIASRGTPARNIFLGGFSNGGAAALTAAVRLFLRARNEAKPGSGAGRALGGVFAIGSALDDDAYLFRLPEYAALRARALGTDRPDDRQGGDGATQDDKKECHAPLKILMCHGKEDPVIPVADGRRTAQRIVEVSKHRAALASTSVSASAGGLSQVPQNRARQLEDEVVRRIVNLEWNEYGRLRHGINDGEMRMLSTWINGAIAAPTAAANTS